MAKGRINMQNTASKKGAASIFVVVFTTILLGILALGFIGIMISDANQTVNFNLSQSAYDSALAGIEDAKIALLKYNQCINQGAPATPGTPCGDAIIAMTTAYDRENCDIVSDMLSRPHVDNQETIIQSEEGDNASDIARDGSANMEQAYTCVRIAEDTDDYLGTLNGNYRTKIIPIRTVGNVSEVNRIRLEWYNSEDDNKLDTSAVDREIISHEALRNNKMGFSQTYSASNVFGQRPAAPPIMQFQLIQTDTTFTLAQFDLNSNEASNRGALFLRPSDAINATNLVKTTKDEGVASSADRSFNNPIDIKCSLTESGSYRCRTDIAIPDPVQFSGATGTRNSGATFIRLILPYQAPDTSFSLALLSCSDRNTETPDEDCSSRQFSGVQTRVDSTGRANDLFRRVEARLEMVDVYYPFPEFVADINNEVEDSIRKNFWVSYNCWTTGGTNRGTNCPDSGEL